MAWKLHRAVWKEEEEEVEKEMWSCLRESQL